ncbi:MAG TPA: MFS transporter [Solirubrobacteraceae bacterium]|nr:MFS transporter [Solirubrobacteraceae bacterium]
MGRGLDSPRAWGVVAAAFAAMFVAFGIAYSYGAFLEEMRADFGVGRAAGATFFSLTSLLYFGLGSVSGAASDRFGPRRVLLVGAVALGLGLVATARADSLGVALAAYGLGVGIGVACAYVPLVALVGAWFERRRTLALGVAVAGIGIGTLTIPPATAALIEAVGWRDSYLVLAAVGAGALALCALAVAPAPAGEGTVFSSLGDALRDRQYRLLYLAIALLGVPLFVPFVYLPSYAEERGVDPVLAAALIGAIGTASVAGRLALGALAGRLGLLRVFRGCFLAIALSFVLWWVAGGSYPVLLLFSIVLGAGYGGFVALAPAVLAERFGVERLGALLGILYTSAGIGSAVGPPAAGAVIDAGGYTPAIAASLAIGLAASAVAAAR